MGRMEALVPRLPSALLPPLPQCWCSPLRSVQRQLQEMGQLGLVPSVGLSLHQGALCPPQAVPQACSIQRPGFGQQVVASLGLEVFQSQWLLQMAVEVRLWA